MSDMEKRLALSRVLEAWKKVPDMSLVELLVLHRAYPGEHEDVWLDGLSDAVLKEKMRRARKHLPTIPRRTRP